MYSCECLSLRDDGHICNNYNLEGCSYEEWENLRNSRPEEARILDFIIAKECYDSEQEVIMAQSEHLYTVQSRNPVVDEDFVSFFELLYGGDENE